MKLQIIIRFILFFFCLSMMVASAKANYLEGVKWYNNRHLGSMGEQASEQSINKSINFFLLELNNPKHDEIAALYLLKSYYYKGEFAIQDKQKKRKIFNDGKILGEKYIIKYPNSAKIRYWYLVNLGSWAKVYGIITAAKEGVADLMKQHSEKIIELDSQYQNGGGYFMLGAVHYKSPYIPFLLSWPDNKEAIKYLKKSLNTGKPTLNQKKYFAKAIIEDGQINNAKIILNEIVNSEPDPKNIVEDLNEIKEAITLLNKL